MLPQRIIQTKDTSNLWTWGANTGNAIGVIGDGASATRSSPVQVGATTTWSSAVTGAWHMAAVKNDGTLWAWGNGIQAGQLGQNKPFNSLYPVQIGTLATWSIVGSSAGRFSTHAIKTDGTLWGWGSASSGALGDNTGTTRSSPVQIGTLATWS